MLAPPMKASQTATLLRTARRDERSDAASSTLPARATMTRRRGRFTTCRCAAVDAVQGSGERPFDPAHAFPASSGGERPGSSERGESSDDGRTASRSRPEGRRSGDVGGAALLTYLQPTYRTRSPRRGDASTQILSLPFLRQQNPFPSPSQGEIKRGSSEASRRGCPSLKSFQIPPIPVRNNPSSAKIRT